MKHVAISATYFMFRMIRGNPGVKDMAKIGHVFYVWVGRPVWGV